FDQGQQIALHAFARHIGADAAVARADLVDLVEEDDAVIFDDLDRLLRQLIGVQQLVGFLIDQNIIGLYDSNAPRFGPATAELAENIADRDRAHLRAGHAGNIKQRQTATAG